MTFDMGSLRDVNIPSIALRLILAMLVGGLLGIERGRRNRPAGFRTYMLVCLGASVVMMTNQYVYKAFQASDPARLGAQVISGIGFLGAGSIIVTGRNQIKGLTTAAGLWGSACVGLAIGIGFYEAAVLSFAAIFVIMVLLRKPDSFIHSRADTAEFFLEYEGGLPFSAFMIYARDNQLKIREVQMIRNRPAEGESLSMTIQAKSEVKRTHAEVAGLLSKCPGVVFLEMLDGESAPRHPESAE
jgi:putative Mg2+ transporter-C (MgtC) family protein